MTNPSSPSEEIVRHESPALDLLAAKLLFGGGKPNASMFWDDENQQLIVKFNEDGKRFAYRKSEQRWYEFPTATDNSL